MKKLLILLLIIGCNKEELTSSAPCYDSSNLIVGTWIFTDSIIEYDNGSPSDITVAGNDYTETMIFYSDNTVYSTQIDSGVTGILEGSWIIEGNTLTIEGTWATQPITLSFNFVADDSILSLIIEREEIPGIQETITQNYSRQCN